ncbi:MAG: trigger factor [Candidatus Bipolaricaulaceae bacterium]
MPSENIQVRREGTRVTLEIPVPKEALRQKEAEILRAWARERSIPGFRPGKAPPHLLLRRYGEEAFWEEVRESLIKEWLAKALKELELHPLSTPNIQVLEFQKGETLAFRAEFDVLPEFTVPEELALEVEEPPPAEAREADIEAVLADLRREAATLKPKDTPAEEGDVVHIRRGEHIWEGTATNDRPLGRQLLGVRAGTRVVLTDEENHAEEFEVVGVYQVLLPTLEETARHYKKGSWEELREEVRAELLARAEARRRDELRLRALDALAEALSLPVPQNLLAETVAEEVQRFPNNPEVRAELEKAIARRLRREILIHRLSEEKNLKPDPQEVRRIAAEEGEDEEKAHSRLLFERTADWVLEHLIRRSK